MNFDELKQKFGPPLDVKPYGLTIVVQGSEFNPDWEAELGDRGYACHFGKLDKHPVVFVPLKRTVAEGKAVYVPPKVPEIGKAQPMVEKKKYALKGPTWTGEDEAELLKAYDDLVLEGKKYGSHKIIAELPQFKGRSIKSIDMKLKRLLKKRRKSEDAAGSQVAEVEQVDKVEEVEKVEKLEAQPELIAKPKQVHGNPRPKMPWLKDVEFWSPDEDALIIELWKKGLPLAGIGVEVNKKYPKRVGTAVTGRVYQLQGKGLIEKRHKPKLKNAIEATSNIPAAKSEKSTVKVESVPASAKYATFEDVWLFADRNESPLKKRAEAFYQAAVAANLPGAIIGSVISCFQELAALGTMHDDQIGDLQKFAVEVDQKIANLCKQFVRHKHAVSGEAMLPMEVYA